MPRTANDQRAFAYGLLARDFDDDGDDIDDIVAAVPFGSCDGWVIVRGLGGGAFKVPDADDCLRGVVTPFTFGIKGFGENVAPALDGDGDHDVLFFGPGNNFERALQRDDGGFDLDMWALTGGPGYDLRGMAPRRCRCRR